MGKYTTVQQHILVRTTVDNGHVMLMDQEWEDEMIALSELGAIHKVDGNWQATKAGYRAGWGLRNFAKRNKGKPGYCAFCGMPEDGHAHFEDGSESWECPLCGFCENYHLDQPKVAPTDERAKQFNDIHGDLRIAWEVAHQWWRVDAMRQDWLNLAHEYGWPSEVVEQAYTQFEAEIKPFDLPPKPETLLSVQVFAAWIGPSQVIEYS